MNICHKLKERRKELGLTMLQVAQKIGVSEATVSRWESGDIANMRRDKIVLLANALQVHPSFIMGESKSQPTQQSNSNNFLIFTPDPSPQTQKITVFNKNGTPGAREKILPSNDVLNEINKLVKALQPYPAKQINALLKIVENGGNIPIKADMPQEIKELIAAAVNLPLDKLKTLIQVAKGMG